MRGRLLWHHRRDSVDLYHMVPDPRPLTRRGCESVRSVAVAVFDRKFDRWVCNMTLGGCFFGATCFEVLTIASARYRMDGGVT